MINEHRVHQIYRPISSQAGQALTPYLESGTFYYYSYARWAIYHGLLSFGVKAGDKILVPDFICRDFLAPINQLKLSIEFYSLGQDLRPRKAVEELPSAKVIVAVNYFGIPAPLEYFKSYCELHHAYLLEDNAHGFLSKDANGNLLGTRGDIGIFSFRKTFPIGQGGGLFIKEGTPLASTPKILPPHNEQNAVGVKERLRPYASVLGPKGIQNLTKGLRLVRKIVTGKAVVESEEENEKEMPGIDSPPAIEKLLKQFDEEEEIQKRIELYHGVDLLLSTGIIVPLLKELPPHCVPYSYAYYCDQKNIAEVKRMLSKHGMECFRWPSLPSQVEGNVPNFYHNLWLVRWLW